MVLVRLDIPIWSHSRGEKEAEEEECFEEIHDGRLCSWKTELNQLRQADWNWSDGHEESKPHQLCHQHVRGPGH